MKKVTVYKDADRPTNIKSRPGLRYSTKQKYEAVALYKLLGSLAEVGRQLGINYITLQDWKRQDWWKDFEYDLTLQTRTKTTAKLEGIRDAAITVVMDRLQNGDFIFDARSGEINRKPINAHVANRILNDSIDKAVLIEKLNDTTKTVATQEKIADRLLLIQQKFREMVAKTKTLEKREVIDAIDVKDISNGDETSDNSEGSLRPEGQDLTQDPESNEVEASQGEVSEEQIGKDDQASPEADHPESEGGLFVGAIG